MYFFYVDESGTKDPQTTGLTKDGQPFEKDWLYVLFAISLYNWKWDKFDNEINARKMRMIHRVSESTNERFDLADAEIHSTVVRSPKQRAANPFFKHLHESEISHIIEAFYHSISNFYMNCFAVVVDKRQLPGHYTQEILHKKSYEMLLEKIETFLRIYHPKNKGLVIMDNSNKTLNRKLAMKHSYILKNGSSLGVSFQHIVEMPMFVESNLSNGAQLADLCAYNCYHAIKYNKPDYSYFQKMLPSFYNSPKNTSYPFDGIKIFPDSSEIKSFLQAALDQNKRAIELMPDSP